MVSNSSAVFALLSALRISLGDGSSFNRQYSKSPMKTRPPFSILSTNILSVQISQCAYPLEWSCSTPYNNNNNNYYYYYYYYTLFHLIINIFFCQMSSSYRIFQSRTDSGDCYRFMVASPVFYIRKLKSINYSNNSQVDCF